MKIAARLLTLTTALLMVVACNKVTHTPKIIGTMPDIESGYQLGVSACYAATAEGRMLLAGGCNFPETSAAEGGKKRYYKGIYSSPTSTVLQWEKVGELPEASAYGVSLSHGNSLIIVGGMNENGPHGEAYMISPAEQSCRIKRLPPLPCTIDNAAGAISGNRIYVIGGNIDGKPSTKVFTLDINNPSLGWNEKAPYPGRGRVQPICAATDEALYIWGGFTPKDSTGEATLHCDGAKYEFRSDKWSHLPAVTDEAGNELTLSGGTALTIDNNKIIATGGVDRTIFEDAISGRYQCIAKDEYMHQPVEWYKFNKKMLLFDTTDEKWETICDDKIFARAGALLTTDGENIFYVGGELKPGIRTAEIAATDIEIAKKNN